MVIQEACHNPESYEHLQSNWFLLDDDSLFIGVEIHFRADNRLGVPVREHKRLKVHAETGRVVGELSQP